jgi:hypothetical protein
MHCVSIEEDHWLMLYTEILVAYSENHTEDIENNTSARNCGTNLHFCCLYILLRFVAFLPTDGRVGSVYFFP